MKEGNDFPWAGPQNNSVLCVISLSFCMWDSHESN